MRVEQRFCSAPVHWFRMLCPVAVLTMAAVLLFPGILRSQDRVHAWQEDLDTAVTQFLPKDRSFSAAERMAFERAIATLYDSVAALSDREIVVRLAQAVAVSNEAHTRAYLLRNRAYWRRYPIRVWWFSEGLHVVAAKAAYEDLLGRRIVEIAGRPLPEVAALVEPLYAGNDSWDRYMSTYTLTSPDVLLGLGLIHGHGAAEFTFEDDRGRRSRRRVKPLVERRSEESTESWWALSPLHPDTNGPWASALPADAAALPLYLRRPTRNYWFEYLPEDSLLYFQLNRSSAMKDEPFEAFQERFLAAIHAHQPQKLVVDLRFNTGGNLTTPYPLFQKLAELPLALKSGRLFIITGHPTFSAGLFHAAHLKASAKPVIVGELVGDELDFWAEGGSVVLPNCGLVLHYADRFHGYSPREYPGRKEQGLYFIDMSVPDLQPDIPIALSAADFFARRDPVLEAIRMRPQNR